MKKKLLAAAMLLAAVFVAPIRGDVIEQVLVKVNGDIITKTELEQRQVAVLRQRMQGQIDPEALKNDETLKKMLVDVTPQVIVNAIDELLLFQRGRELGYRLSDDQFKAVVANIRKENKLEDEAKFQQALAQEGMSMDDLRRQLERQMVIEQVQRQEVGSKLTITEEEARQYYARHPEDFTDPAAVTLREIFVEVPVTDRGVNVAEDDAAKAKAEQIRKRLLSGEPFAQLAAEASDAPSKANGGLIGPIKRDELAEPLQKMLDAMKVGELTAVLRTQRGYQILKLDSRTETKIRTFDEARSDISNRVGETKMTGERMKYLERLRAQATITWRNDELKKAYEIALAARQKALAG